LIVLGGRVSDRFNQNLDNAADFGSDCLIDAVIICASWLIALGVYPQKRLNRSLLRAVPVNVIDSIKLEGKWNSMRRRRRGQARNRLNKKKPRGQKRSRGIVDARRSRLQKRERTGKQGHTTWRRDGAFRYRAAARIASPSAALSYPRPPIPHAPSSA
jgi:hypothetical protein